MIDAVMTTLRAQAADADAGLAVKVAAIAAARGYASDYLSTEYVFERWSLADKMHVATKVRAALAPTSADVTWRPLQAGPREALHRLSWSLERVHNDPAVLEDGITADALGILQLLDECHTYSRNHSGTIALVDGSIAMRFGSFGGPSTSGGCKIDFTVLEQSQE